MSVTKLIIRATMICPTALTLTGSWGGCWDANFMKWRRRAMTDNDRLEREEDVLVERKVVE
ncbi:hypothetical protein KKE60_04445 [Patescibacteria group bacterium]|nr:hypothetical protein [Patescibacteria group bacterium]